jgi:hypothetical protein
MVNGSVSNKYQSLGEIVEAAINAYHSKYGNDAPSPNTAPLLGKKYIHLFHEGKRLCRFNIETNEIDQTGMALRGRVKLLKEIEYLRKRYCQPFPLEDEIGGNYKYYQMDYDEWLQVDAATNKSTKVIKVVHQEVFFTKELEQQLREAINKRNYSKANSG